MLGNDFGVFILTHGRPEKVITYKTLKKNGYTGKIFLVVDTLDKTLQSYKELYGEEVIVFNKHDYVNNFDIGNNFNETKGVVFARNAVFDLAKEKSIKYFLVLDDDYSMFEFRYDHNKQYIWHRIRNNLDGIFKAALDFYKVSGAHSLAFSQGGDFIGGGASSYAKKINLTRKCMNSFFCDVDKPFNFMGAINEDTNAYTSLAPRGHLFFTTNLISLVQKTTQSNSGGLTEIYLESGTYVKSFYSVMFHPSSVKIKMMGDRHKRLHHSVKWNNTTPKIIRQVHKKINPSG